MGKYRISRLEQESKETNTSLQLIINLNILNEIAESNRLRRMNLQRVANDCYSSAQIGDEADLLK